MSIPAFVLGAVVHIQTTITSSTGSTVGVDPGSLTFYLKEPDGTTYSYVYAPAATTVIKSTTGVYYVDWPSAKEGIHRFGWVGTSANAGADEGAFHVIKRLWD